MTASVRTTAALPIFVFVGALSVAPVTASQTPAGGATERLALAPFIAEVDRLAALLDSDNADWREQLAAIPDTWHVADNGVTFDVSSSSLAEVMHDAAVSGELNPEHQARARIWLHALSRDLHAFSRDRVDSAAAHRVLDSVLATREFGSVRGPGAWAIWRERVMRWFRQQMDRIFGSASPRVRDWLAYLLIAAAVAGVGRAFLRSLRAGPTRDALDVSRGPAAPREWHEWRADIDKAVARSDWRAATHAIYWCAVSFLESRGMWRQDRARTPRDYPPLLAADPIKRDLLTGLTDQFERTWYAGQASDAAAVATARTTLDKLGCPQS